MKNFKELREYIDNLKRSKGNEIEFKTLKKWMINELGVEELSLKGGSHVPFKHRVLIEPNNPEGIFQIALKKNKILFKQNFRTHTYKKLLQIIDLLEEESKSGN